MIWPPARKDAEAFANALEGRGSLDDDLRGLVRLAESLGDASVDPSPEFLADLRSQLMAEAATVLVAPAMVTTPAAPRRARKRLAAAAIGAITVAGGMGITATSAQALPGDMLYPVKRGVETVQLSLHRSEASRGAFELGQASKRLAEAKKLVAAKDARDASAVTQSLTDFAHKATTGSQALFDDFGNDGNRKSINKVAAFATSSNSTLVMLAESLPKDSTAAFKTAAATINGLVTQASTLCDECQRADLSDLASKVQAIATSVHDSSTPADANKIPIPAVSSSTPEPRQPGPSTATSAPPPTTSAPTAAPPPSLGQLTDPIIGALLGDDSQPGLVPGLLGGLLGGE